MQILKLPSWTRTAVSSACGVLLGASALVPAGAAPVAGEPSARQQQYAIAAEQQGVPLAVLLAVSYLESRWDTNAGTPSTSGGYGPMHLTDVTPAASPAGAGDLTADARGDVDEPTAEGGATTGSEVPAAGARTLDLAAGLTGVDPATLRTDPAANIAGGAAVLASYQRAAGQPTGADSSPADWYAAVARYSGATDADTAAAFADEVYGTLTAGTSRTTDDGQLVELTAMAASPQRAQLDLLRLPRLAASADVQCPHGLPCDWVPAAHALVGTGGSPLNYGNYDTGNRPLQQKIDYIVLHDTEISYADAMTAVQNPSRYVGWHYTVRSADGHVTQHVKIKDVPWHAGNWYVNAKSIGIEHEGYAAQGTWYTEAMYRASAKLVRYLAARYEVPLDRGHILGHDNVPAPDNLNNRIRKMHTDPGPYWDWAHYFDLLGAPLHGSASANSALARAGTIMIKPEYVSNRPAFTGCSGGAANPCPLHGSAQIVLRTAPREDAPLVTDVGLATTPGTMGVLDLAARASTGQRYAVAERHDDWVAIWYLGQKAWFHDPASASTAVWSPTAVATPKPGRTGIPVYGTAFPEPGAYPPLMTSPAVPALAPLPYTVGAGQRYPVLGVVQSEYYRFKTLNGTNFGDGTLVRGTMRYVQIQYGFRTMFVDADDVDVVPPPA